MAREARGLHVERAAILGHRVGQQADHRGALDDHAERQQPLTEQQLPEPGGVLRSHSFDHSFPEGAGGKGDF